MEKDGLLLMLDELRHGVEVTAGLFGGKEYQDYMLEIVDALIEIHTNGTVVPKISGHIKEEADKYIKNVLGFGELTDAEWPLFAAKMFLYADWGEAMTRAFWEEILPLRVGKSANINQHYIHRYVHCECEWETRGYVIHSHKCPVCGEILTPTGSVPVSNEG